MSAGHDAYTAQHRAMNGASSNHASAPSLDTSDAQPASEAAAAAAGSGMQHCFSEEILDSAVHFQVMDLGRQLYIWVGTSAAQMGSLCFASPLRAPPGAHLLLFTFGSAKFKESFGKVRTSDRYSRISAMHVDSFWTSGVRSCRFLKRVNLC